MMTYFCQISTCHPNKHVQENKYAIYAFAEAFSCMYLLLFAKLYMIKKK